MALYATREGPMATANVWTNLAAYGAQTVNSVVVPSGYSSIKELWVSKCPPGAYTTATGGVFLIRLSGSGLKYGPVDIPVGGTGAVLTGNSALGEYVAVQKFPVDIALNGSGEIWVKGMPYSTDVGTPELAVTLVLTKASAGMKKYLIRNITWDGTVDTKTAMTTDGDTTASGAILVPAGCTKITKIFGAMGGVLTATAVGGTAFVRLEGNGLKNGDQVIPIGGASCLSNTTGVDGCVSHAAIIPTDLDVTPSGQIFCYVEMSGVDLGTPYAAVGLEFSEG